ncbi:hypothetical protein ASE63_15645 [Bosea sp. Root381]|jgi:hypothetical protein|uniref:hypothetical protein n=1 Tax=Bosea sp. Root381 TaxID=1736524 RepID=UPI000701D85E|nr:hypothetical protein [Bosea sp. Root381]KRE15687.1 hypothetical protein ASE63_15645 [Bosea sp. Root381]
MDRDTIDGFASLADDLVILLELARDIVNDSFTPDMPAEANRLLIQAETLLAVTKEKAEGLRSNLSAAYRAMTVNSPAS